MPSASRGLGHGLRVLAARVVGATPKALAAAARLAVHQLHAAARAGGAPVFALERHRQKRGLLFGRAAGNLQQARGNCDLTPFHKP